MSVELLKSKLLPEGRTNRCWPARHQNHQPCREARFKRSCPSLLNRLSLITYSFLALRNRTMSDHRDWRGSLTASERYDNIQRM